MGVPNLIPRPGPPGTGAPPQFTEFFDEGVPTNIPPQAGEEGFSPQTVQDIFDEMINQGRVEEAQIFMENANLWHLARGIAFDPSDPAQSQQYFAAILGPEPPEPPPAGPAGRTQFASEAELDLATAALRRQQAETEASQRALLAEQEKTQAFNRARDKWDLLQATDQLADARRQAVTAALTELLPFMVDPGQEFTPGFEPGGVGPELGNLLGVNVPTQQLPTMEVPLNELANPPLAAPPEAIAGGLESLL